MDSPPPHASLEAQLFSLKADTLLIFSKVAKGFSDEEIVKWSSSWSFTEQKIAKALKELYSVFGLGQRKPEMPIRQALMEIYEECKSAGLLAASVTNSSAQNKATVGGASTSEETKMSGVRLKKQILFNDVDINSLAFRRALVENVKYLGRTYMNMSLQNIATGIGKGPQFLSQVKLGTSKIGIDALVSIAKILKVRPTFLATLRELSVGEFKEERDVVLQLQAQKTSAPTLGNGNDFVPAVENDVGAAKVATETSSTLSVVGLSEAGPLEANVTIVDGVQQSATAPCIETTAAPSVEETAQLSGPAQGDQSSAMFLKQILTNPSLAEKIANFAKVWEAFTAEEKQQILPLLK